MLYTENGQIDIQVQRCITVLRQIRDNIQNLPKLLQKTLNNKLFPDKLNGDENWKLMGKTA